MQMLINVSNYLVRPLYQPIKITSIFLNKKKKLVLSYYFKNIMIKNINILVSVVYHLGVEILK